MYEPRPYILLIDDDEDDLEMFSSALKINGINVKTFDSSVKALSYLALMADNMERPSLIIMDYNMPKRNGEEALLLIKANSDTKDIPVVIYSTSMPDPLRYQLSKAGALDCFSKPWNTQELNMHVEKFLDLSFAFVATKNIA